ncbi:unnamed protein product [Acanthoscelides obtectus]|uniref:Winged helix-turn-helix domain-containing protein n=1 Tax=Acanthoscelides obtectus TaxID=200917 RepID=A0A9P0KD60_ACAOB|nr:unnamed protein product [Acanthoscelides obtectus]CAK1635738.1 hypothetical protein AOBTE_LOCUS9471 [Acanthoscelides obtectus]
MTDGDEQVMMTPKCKTATSTTLIIERRKVNKANDKMHVAGGEHTGIIINKETATENGETSPPQLSLEFRVFLVNKETGKHTQESRTLMFWFRDSTLIPNGTTNGGAKDETDADMQATTAQDFFRELVSPQEFPRDYVGFIKKIMKLMQHNYKNIVKLEVELKQLREPVEVPSRPLSAEETSLGNIVILTVEKVLEIIESSYPNPVTIKDIAAENGWDEEEVAQCLSALQSRNLVKAMEHGAFTRQQSQHDTHRVTVVKQMPAVAGSKQPTIAIITAQYAEKLAVDAMMEDKETFVRYTTVGESNVYTLGTIGAHRIVSTKLPAVGHTREATTAAGNTTTRLLGTFQKVEHVFLVGVGGGVPHYTDYNKHVRLGDVVVSYPGKDKSVYIYCENAICKDKGFEFETKSYKPSNLILQEIAQQLKAAADSDPTATPPWMNYLRDGLNTLSAQTEPDFRPPSSETDKLYMSIGERDLIEVAHPTPQDSSVKRLEGCPRIHLSPVASGRQVVRDDRLRQQFASKAGALAFDCEVDPVIESILGNCKESFVCVRGIADYKDGTRRKEWQPYAALAAASVMKAVVCGMEPPTNV